MDTIEAITEQNRKMINHWIDKYFEKFKKQSRLIKAMIYGVSNGGKRIRPFLVIELSKFFNIPKTSYLNLAAAIELIHCYSLIHDDLPPMDNDDFRRGGLATHKKFDEATAILAGNALYSLAINILSQKQTTPSPDIQSRLCQLTTELAGVNGLLQGQSYDLLPQKKKPSKEDILNTYILKTSKLFEIAMIAPCLVAQSSKIVTKNAQIYGRNFGIIYQTIDDLLDKTGSSTRQSPNSTKKKNVAEITLVDVIGVEKSIRLCDKLAHEATKRKRIFGSDQLPFKDLIFDIIERRS